MAFGQPDGPPAGRRQIEQLSALVERAGFATFKEARHPLGLNQRQSAGRFTAAEADELIERLEAAETVGGSDAGAQEQEAAPPPARPRSAAAASARPDRRPRRTLSSLEDAVLVAELERRGWCCIPPVEQLD